MPVCHLPPCLSLPMAVTLSPKSLSLSVSPSHSLSYSPSNSSTWTSRQAFTNLSACLCEFAGKKESLTANSQPKPLQNKPQVGLMIQYSPVCHKMTIPAFFFIACATLQWNRWANRSFRLNAYIEANFTVCPLFWELKNWKEKLKKTKPSHTHDTYRLPFSII